MWSPDLWLMDSVLTVFWVVGIMNSLNMLDNMDAVTTTIATTIIVTTLSMIIIQEGLSNTFYIMIAIAGGFIGFLFWNWKPAKDLYGRYWKYVYRYGARLCRYHVLLEC